jgi:hypothetical protein
LGGWLAELLQRLPLYLLSVLQRAVAQNFRPCSLNATECSLNATECSLNATECSLNATECSLNATIEYLIHLLGGWLAELLQRLPLYLLCVLQRAVAHGFRLHSLHLMLSAVLLGRRHLSLQHCLGLQQPNHLEENKRPSLFQGTFRETLESIEGTSREHLGNIKGSIEC